MITSEDRMSTGRGRPQPWPIFICYRQSDGLAAARRIHELIDKFETDGPDGEPIRLDVYLDQTMPAVADWRELHKPYLERARAIIVVCSPGARIDEGPDDWVYREIRWWLEHRETAPILIDPLRQGLRYVPVPISARWPEIQRIALVEAEWTHLPPAELEEKASALRRQIVAGHILPSGAAVYAKELAAEQERAANLQRALDARTRAMRWLAGAFVAAMVLLAVAAGAGYYASVQRGHAEVNRRVTEASLHDARAAAGFAEARGYELRWEGARQRQTEIQGALSAIVQADDVSTMARRQNLQYELAQLHGAMTELAVKAAVPRQQGYAELELADRAWSVLKGEGHSGAVAARRRPDPPSIFSIELLDAGRGESILVHYGTPDRTSLVMINGGSRDAFKTVVEPRLKSLRQRRFAGAPVPIELAVATDQDADKIDGFVRLLSQTAQAATRDDRLVEIRRLWANVFATHGVRGEFRGLMEKNGIRPNAPFDHLVMRPDEGRATVELPGGLEIVVLGPRREHVEELHEMARRQDKNRGPEGALASPVVALPAERFSRVANSADGAPLPTAVTATDSADCRPSENARALARVAAADRSVPNLASTVLLFRFRGKTFLHSGDSRADLILDNLAATGLKPDGGRVRVDLLHLPHYASDRNLTPEFLEQVTADEYLFSGDGSHGNPEIASIAALIHARPCQAFVMNFVNRDGVAIDRRWAAARTETSLPGAERIRTHGEKLDAFFAAEETYKPRYRRVFRATDHSSVVIDLLDRLTY